MSAPTPVLPAPSGSPSSAGGVAAVDRALSLLCAFRHGDVSLTLTELSERTGLYPSTVSRLLASLVRAGFIERIDKGRYQLGLEVVRLHAVFSASSSLERIIKPVLQQLVETTGESAAYHVRVGDARLCLYRVDSPHPIRDHTREGDVLPLHSGSGGRVLTAFGASPAGGWPAGDAALYARIRHDGYFGAAGDRRDSVAGISAPVFRADGELAGAMTLTMPVDRYDVSYVAEVRRAAERLSRLM